MASTPKKRPLIFWQLPMTRVLKSLIPVVIAAIYFFGWRALFVLLVSNIAAFLTEYLYNRHYNQPVSSAVFVSAFLFALTLPPTIPYWMAAVGIIVGILFGKMVFGGFGRNVFNPALTGRAFIYVSFGMFMTGKEAWVEPVGGFPGGFGAYLSDTISSATPMKLVAAEGFGIIPIWKFLAGNISGSLGETSAILIILGGLFLIWKKAANWRIVVACIIGGVLTASILWLAKIPETLDPFTFTFGGAFWFAIMYMATDPISAAQTNTGRWIYGIMIGALVALIKTFSVWPAGAMFAILLGNMFAPIIDYLVKQQSVAKKAKAKGAP